jgi:hypothetical protein
MTNDDRMRSHGGQSKKGSMTAPSLAQAVFAGAGARRATQDPRLPLNLDGLQTASLGQFG